MQRQAALHIMGAMRTSPTDSLDAHTDLLPFQLLTEQLVHRAAARLFMLPTSHPLAKHVSGVARRYVKRHQAPLHEVMHAFRMRPDDYETISPVRRGPKWTPNIQVVILATKMQAVKEAEEAKDDIKVFSDGSCIDSKVGVAAVLFRGREEFRSIRKLLGSDDEHTMFEAEMVGLTLEAELVCTERVIGLAMLGADSQEALRATMGTKGALGCHLVDRFH